MIDYKFHKFKNLEKVINTNAIVSINVYHLEVLDVYPRHIVKDKTFFTNKKVITKYVYDGEEYDNVNQLLDSVYHPMLGNKLKFDNMKNIFYFSPSIKIEFSNKDSLIKEFSTEEELMEFYCNLTNNNTKENFIKIN